MLHGRPSVFFSLVCPYTFYCHCFPCPVLPLCDRPALRPEGPLPSGTAGGSLHPKTLQGSLLCTQCKRLHVAHRSCQPRPSPALASVPWSPGGAAGRLLALHGSPFPSQAFVHAPVPLLPRLCPSFRAHLKGCLLRSCPDSPDGSDPSSPRFSYLQVPQHHSCWLSLVLFLSPPGFLSSVRAGTPSFHC